MDWDFNNALKQQFIRGINPRRDVTVQPVPTQPPPFGQQPQGRPVPQPQGPIGVPPRQAPAWGRRFPRWNWGWGRFMGPRVSPGLTNAAPAAPTPTAVPPQSDMANSQPYDQRTM